MTAAAAAVAAVLPAGRPDVVAAALDAAAAAGLKNEEGKAAAMEAGLATTALQVRLVLCRLLRSASRSLGKLTKAPAGVVCDALTVLVQVFALAAGEQGASGAFGCQTSAPPH
jgi:hypothetical protein